MEIHFVSSVTVATDVAPPPHRLDWLIAKVLATRNETLTVTTLVLDVPAWPGHVAGQHLDVRLTAPDGYRAQRSYSIASAPDGSTRLEITVQNVDAGEVSPFLTSVVAVGDALELRGPIGDYFTWVPGSAFPLVLVAGGSGIVPLMAMLRNRVQGSNPTPTWLLYSSRDYESIIFREELELMAKSSEGFTLLQTLTRTHPLGWNGECRRIDRALLEAAAFPSNPETMVFVCGPTSMVETVAGDLVTMGYSAGSIKTERFGPT